MAKPEWESWVQWSKAFRVPDLITKQDQIPVHPGFYAFTEDPFPLRRDHVLYIGETARKGGLRARLRSYLIADPAATQTGHKGALFLLDHRLRNRGMRAKTLTDEPAMFVRWAPFDTDKVTRRQLEAAMMQYYNCAFNHRDMKADTPFDSI